MPSHVIIGRGATASATAVRLAESGDQVRVISRSGTGPQHPDIELIATDAVDAAALTDLVKGADTVFNTAMPAYHTWPEAGTAAVRGDTVGRGAVRCELRNAR